MLFRDRGRALEKGQGAWSGRGAGELRECGMKEAPRGGGVPAEHERIVMCEEEECVPAALHAHAPAVSRDPVVWESPEPRVVEPDPDLYSLDVMLRRHGMCHGANMMTDHENAMQHAVGRLRRWSI